MPRNVAASRTDNKREARARLIALEGKADNVTISPKDYAQGESYARIVDAPFFVTHNNRESRYWRIKKDRMPGYIEEITDIPRADASDKEIAELVSRLKVFREDKCADLHHHCHSITRNREHLDPAAAFDEIAKVLFMRVCFERRLRRSVGERPLVEMAPNRYTAVVNATKCWLQQSRSRWR